jgi:hypothetical protein
MKVKNNKDGLRNSLIAGRHESALAGKFNLCAQVEEEIINVSRSLKIRKNLNAIVSSPVLALCFNPSGLFLKPLSVKMYQYCQN